MQRSRNYNLFVLVLSLFLAALPMTAQSLLPDLPMFSQKIDRYEGEIKAFEATDKKTPVRPGETLFVGSSTFRLWTNLEGNFKESHAVNRAFGGATIDEINHYANRMVIPYKPSRIVFYAGTNDLAEGDSPKDVYQDFLEFEKIVHKSLPNTKIYFVSMSPGPVRKKLQSKYDAANDLILAESKRSGKFKFIDIRPVMYEANGRLKENLFGIDRLHMNRAGQQLWEPIIKEALRKDQ